MGALFFVLAYSFLSFSNPLFETALSENWDQHYTPLACSDNVLALYKNLKNKLDSSTEVYVLHIRHKNAPYSPIFALQQRTKSQSKSYPPQAWVFHAVLLVENMVLDLDYTNSPTPVPFEAYFHQMWKHEELKNYIFEIKEAKLYSSLDLDGTMSSDFWGPMGFEELQIKKAQLFL